MVTQETAEAWEEVIIRAIAYYIAGDNNINSDEYEMLMDAIGDLKMSDFPKSVSLSMRYHQLIEKK